ncbi:hypothetical protein J5X84_04410 [Streptosporangiaceae bacterium NEAU-GS5]|nr:hypothetical protein [Streptosporangiaceae bacterium NEAU-GS5]
MPPRNVPAPQRGATAPPQRQERTVIVISSDSEDEETTTTTDDQEAQDLRYARHLQELQDREDLEGFVTSQLGQDDDLPIQDDEFPTTTTTVTTIHTAMDATMDTTIDTTMVADADIPAPTVAATSNVPTRPLPRGYRELQGLSFGRLQDLVQFTSQNEDLTKYFLENPDDPVARVWLAEVRKVVGSSPAELVNHVETSSPTLWKVFGKALRLKSTARAEVLAELCWCTGAKRLICSLCARVCEASPSVTPSRPSSPTCGRTRNCPARSPSRWPKHRPTSTTSKPMPRRG